MLPHFRSREFLIQSFADSLAYLYPRCRDDAGDLGDKARLTGDFALAYQEFGDPAYLQVAQQGMAALSERAADQGPHAANVLSAYARAASAGVPGARQLAEHAASKVPQQASPPCARVCMALVEAFEATDNPAHLQHAERLARAAADAGTDTAPQWARALMALERHRSHLPQGGDWLQPAASRLFAPALHGAGTAQLDADGDALAAAALLGARTGRVAYWATYDSLWAAQYRRADLRGQARLIGACAQVLEVIASAP